MTTTATPVTTHAEAHAAVTAIAAAAGNLPVYWGTGYPIEHPHVLAVAYPFEVSVTVYPTGEHYQGTDQTRLSITVDPNA